MTDNDKKKAQIKIIKTAQTKLGLDDGTYRDLLRQTTGKDSCTKMSIEEREKVIKVMEQAGFKRTVPNKYGRKPNIGEGHASRKAKIDKIGALLTNLDKKWEYAHGIARNRSNGKRQSLDFCSDAELTIVIAALQKNLTVLKKRQAKAEPTGTT